MADGDPLAPGSIDLRGWQYPGQWWGLPNPYAGLPNPMTDPLFNYTFGPPPIRPDQPELADPQHGLYPELAGIGINLDPALTGSVEWGAPLDDPLMAQLQYELGVQSTGLAPPGGQLGASDRPPGVFAPQPGTLQSDAGFGDIVGGLGE